MSGQGDRSKILGFPLPPQGTEEGAGKGDHCHPEGAVEAMSELCQTENIAFM